MFGLGTIIPPSSMLGLIHTEIEKQLKKDVAEFSIIYKAKDHSIVFRIPTDNPNKPDFHAFESTLISDTIKGITNQKLDKSQILDYVIINYYRDRIEDINADVYYVNTEGVKETAKFKL